jgi:hypothetical protein
MRLIPPCDRIKLGELLPKTTFRKRSIRCLEASPVFSVLTLGATPPNPAFPSTV